MFRMGGFNLHFRFVRRYGMKQQDIRITTSGEIDLTDHERAAISGLLQHSFEQYPAGKIYFPQPPHFRVLGWSGDLLIGHLGGMIREVAVGNSRLLVMGVCDLCVDPAMHRQRWASMLLDRLESLAAANGIQYVVAISREMDFFQDRGFQSIDPRCIWLAYLDGRSLGLYRRHLGGDIHVKCLSKGAWPDGELDLLGPMF